MVWPWGRHYHLLKVIPILTESLQRPHQSHYFQVLSLDSALSKPSLFKNHTTSYTQLLHKMKNFWAALSKSESLLLCVWQQIFHSCMTYLRRLTRNRILEVDEFIAQLWQVHLKVKEEGYVQVWCGNLRSNYMLRHFRTFLWGCSGPITWSTKAQMILRPQLNKWNSIPLLHLLVDCRLRLLDYTS